MSKTIEKGAGNIESLKNNPVNTNLDNLENYIEGKLKFVDSKLDYGNGVTIQPEFDLSNKENNELYLKVNGIRLGIKFTYTKEGFDALINAYGIFLTVINGFLKSDLQLRNGLSPIDFSSEKSMKGKITGSKQNHIYADGLTSFSPDIRVINFSDFQKGLNLQKQDAIYVNNLENIFVEFLNQVKDKLPKNPINKDTIQT